MKKILTLFLFAALKSVYAQEPKLVKDFNTNLDINSQTFTNIFTMNGKLFMNGKDTVNNSELWISDGTPSGTKLLKDINPGRAASNPYAFSVKGNTFYFFANDGTGYDLWKSDGTTAGTTKVKDIFSNEWSGHLPSDPIVVCNSKIYFFTDTDKSFRQLWSSDGTTSGTFVLKDSITNNDDHLFDGGNFLYFIIAGQIYKSDGTKAGTKMINNVANITGIGLFKGSLYYYSSEPGNSGKIWKTDGSVASTSVVRSGIYIPYNKFLITGNYIFFSACDSSQFNAELWVTDGTTLGTKQIKDILPGPLSSYPRAFAVMNGEVYFHASDVASSSSLWRTDGTTSGTVMVKKWEYPTTNYDYYFTPDRMMSADNKLYFLHTDSLGAELWESDGTGTGTFMVKDIYPGPSSAFNFYPFFTVIGTKIYFVANDGSGQGFCLWGSDGTSAGTQMIKFNYLPTASSGIKNLVSLNNTLYFSTSNVYEPETILWRSDGTGTGSVKIKSYSYGTLLNSFTKAGNSFYFSVFNNSDSTELWKSDGTPSGTILVSRFLSGWYCPGRGPCVNSCGINEMVYSKGLLYISASGSSKVTRSLFVSDGSKAGTYGLKAIWTAGLTAMESGIYFSADNVQTGIELWKSDGTAGGTQMVMDIAPGSQSSDPSGFELIDNIIYFKADDGSHGYELWRSDGSASGTWMIKDINSSANSNYSGSNPWGFIKYKGLIYFAANDGLHGNELWKTDGTSVGTILVADINPGIRDGLIFQSFPGSYGSPNRLFVTEDGIYFIGNNGNGTDGNEIWKSDGTAQGTKMVKAVCPNEMYAPFIHVATASAIYFVNYSYDHGYELWFSDGSSAGTKMLTDINAGMPSSLALINPVIYQNGSLFFPADDGIHGEELWTLKVSDSFTAAGNDPAVVVTSLIHQVIESGYPKVFPNPTTGIFTVQLDQDKSSSYKLYIYNSIGCKIDTQPLQTSPSELSFDMNSYSNGVYYLQLEQGGNKTGRKIIKFE